MLEQNPSTDLLTQQIQWQEKHCKWLYAKLDAVRELDEVSGNDQFEQVEHLTSTIAHAIAGLEILKRMARGEEKLADLIVERWKQEFAGETWNVPSEARMLQMAEWAINVLSQQNYTR